MTSSQVLAATPQPRIVADPAGPHVGPATPRYALVLTTDPDDVRAAQRLRHRVFAGELGARLPHPELDIDSFDAHCDHLVVREETTGEIVGTYRMLPPEKARDAGGTTAAAVLDRVLARHLAPPQYRVTPHRPWDSTGIARPVRAAVPALLRGYLRLGAWVCGPPAHDPDFGCADFPVLLGLDHLDPRYARFFLDRR